MQKRPQINPEIQNIFKKQRNNYPKWWTNQENRTFVGQGGTEEEPKINRNKETANKINDILWNMLTGNAPYKEIFYKAMKPRLVLKMLPINAFAWVRQKWDDVGAWLRRN